MTIGQLIRNKRVGMGMLQRQLAQRLNSSQSHIAHVEAGLKMPSEIQVELLTGLFDLTDEELAEAGALAPKRAPKPFRKEQFEPSFS